MLRDIASRDYISGHVQTSILSVSTAYRHSLLHIIGMDLWCIMGKLATYSLQSVCLWDGIPPLVNNVRVSAWIASFVISARFYQYLEDKPRVFKAIFADEEKIQQVNEVLDRLFIFTLVPLALKLCVFFFFFSYLFLA